MMTHFLRQSVGIDISQKELVVSLGRMDMEMEISIYDYKVFSNNNNGFERLIAWVEKRTVKEVIVWYVMEATGVYHEALAYYLVNHQKYVNIVLPNKINNYAKTLDIKTVTDKSASQAIAQFGLERKQEQWQPPKKIYSNLKQLTRERDQLVYERTMLKNQLHAETTEAFPNTQTITRLTERINLLYRQEGDIKEELVLLIKPNEELTEKVNIISSIPGIGHLTAVIILAETNGFELIKSKKQLASYAGLDIKEKLSGTSVKGKPRISKQGNRNLRKAMHFPALAAIRWDERFKGVFVRLVSKHGIKMKATVAVQRKLLELAYTLWKNDTYYNENHFQEQSTAEEKIRAVTS